LLLLNGRWEREIHAHLPPWNCMSAAIKVEMYITLGRVYKDTVSEVICIIHVPSSLEA
jgi:hypothetical protein